jgi:hypothetical protein
MLHMRRLTNTHQCMKPYLFTTGTIFTLMTAIHIWRAAAEWPHHGLNAPFLLGMSALIILPGALAWWAWSLLRRTK